MPYEVPQSRQNRFEARTFHDISEKDQPNQSYIDPKTVRNDVEPSVKLADEERHQKTGDEPETA